MNSLLLNSIPICTQAKILYVHVESFDHWRRKHRFPRYYATLGWSLQIPWNLLARSRLKFPCTISTEIHSIGGIKKNRKSLYVQLRRTLGGLAWTTAHRKKSRRIWLLNLKHWIESFFINCRHLLAKASREYSKSKEWSQEHSLFSPSHLLLTHLYHDPAWIPIHLEYPSRQMPPQILKRSLLQQERDHEARKRF